MDKLLTVRKSVIWKIDREFKKLNRRATKIGAPPVSYEIVEEYEKRVDEDQNGVMLLFPYFIPMVKIRVEGTAPKFEGWTFLGTLEHTDGGNILRSVPGHTIPEDYRTVERKCDHCQLNRIRKDTFVVRHDDDTTKQVGRQCVKDFLGHRSPENIVQWADFMVRLGDMDLDDDYGFGGWNIKEDPSVGMLDLLAVTSAVIKKYGWVSVGESDATFKMATRSVVQEHFFPPTESSLNARWEAEEDKVKVTDADYDFAERAKEWALNVEPTTDYLGNINVIAANDFATFRQFGIACSIVGVFKRNEEKRMRESTEFSNEWFGNEKERLELTVTVLNTFEKDGMYGLTTIHKMVTDEGHGVVWFGTGNTVLEQGKTYRVNATVKRHNEWNGKNETQVNRVKVIEEIEEINHLKDEEDLFTFEKTINVHCTECDKWMDEGTVEFLNIEEGMRGEDRMTFNCPTCKTKSTSMRVG